MKRALLPLTLLLLAPALAWSQERGPRIQIQMDQTTIRANKELPQLLYIVPWKDIDLSDSTQQRKVIIHNLFGEFYQPIMPGEPDGRKKKDVMSEVESP